MAKIGGSVGTTRGFLQAINRWTRETEERSETAYQNGALDFYDALSDATPVLTGNLRNSLVASVNGNAPAMVTGPGSDPDDSTFRSGAEVSISNIMSAKIGDKISYIYGAPYARRVNLGFTGFDSLQRFYSTPGRFWIEQVGSRYRSIMRAAATRLRMSMK